MISGFRGVAVEINVESAAEATRKAWFAGCAVVSVPAVFADSFRFELELLEEGF